jgi:hypothetical protein
MIILLIGFQITILLFDFVVGHYWPGSTASIGFRAASKWQSGWRFGYGRWSLQKSTKQKYMKYK